MSLEIGPPTNARATHVSAEDFACVFFGFAVFWYMNRYLETRRALREASQSSNMTSSAIQCRLGELGTHPQNRARGPRWPLA